jgi:thiamine-phosphate pyrophosphorylase
MISNFQYYLITDRHLYSQSLAEVATRAEKAGVQFFQLREKDLAVRDLLSVARELRSILKRTAFIVNGQLEVALASGADGVHLQRDNVPVDAVKSKYPALKVGYSAHSLEELEEAEKQGVDYLFISPVFAPSSKPVQALGLGTAKEWASKVNRPVFALGGIKAERISEVRNAGFAGAAGISLFVEDTRFTSKGMVI